MSKQKANYELVSLLSPFFQKRNEVNFGWVNAVSAFNMLPALRTGWLMSATSTTTVPDVTGNNYVLAINNVIFNAQDLIPYADFNGSTAYLFGIDDARIDIIGNEAYVGIPGLSIGGWVWFDALGNQEGIATKDQNGLGNRSYRLIKTTGDVIRFSVSNTGSTVVSVDSAAIAGTGQWMFVCGVYTPSASLKVYLDSTVVENVTSIPATLFNSASPLELGRWATTNYMNGRQSLFFLAASALPDTIVKSFYHQTRPLFGKG